MADINSELDTLETTKENTADMLTAMGVDSQSSESFRALSNKIASISSKTPLITQNFYEGNYTLEEDTAYCLTVIKNPSGNLGSGINFKLPTYESTPDKFHQIVVVLNMMAGVISIDLGTSAFFNNKQPDLTEPGVYTLFYERTNRWTVGAIRQTDMGGVIDDDDDRPSNPGIELGG